MNKQRTIAIEDSNIALIGSASDHKAKLDAAQTEDAWKGVGQKPELRVWRIEAFKVKTVDPSTHGTFFAGDSYIVLHSYKKPGVDTIFHDIHFWIGNESSQDEYGTAAYKTVELDEFLGGSPVQFREVQGNESSKFLANFKQFVVMNGGVATGFKHVEAVAYRSRLLRVAGTRKNVYVSEVPLERASLNSGDVFILDLGTKLYQWNGSASNGQERIKAGEFLQAIKSERHGKSSTEVIAEGDKDVGGFWGPLGGEGPVAPAETTSGDKSSVFKVLYRLSDASGKTTFQKEAEGTIYASMFDSNDVFVFDTGLEVFVWVGKKTSKDERRQAMTYAMKYLVDHKRPGNMQICRVLEGGENESFREALDKQIKK